MIIGKTLESLLYAWKTQQKCIIFEPVYINRHDKKYSILDYDNLNASNAYEYWANLCFCMSLTGLLLYPNNIENIREGDKTLTIATKRSRIVTLNPNTIIWFDEVLKNSFDVYDYFDVRSSKHHQITAINDSSDFVKTINFFPSPRVGATKTKDLVASSVMTREQLLSPDWGNGIVRLKVLRMMDSKGITGSLSLRTENKTYYKKPKISFYKRVVSQKVETLHSLEDITNMKQVKGDAWKTVQILKAK